MTTSYVVPQALVYQEFSVLPEALAQPLLACVVGPRYQLVTDNIRGLLGTYDPLAEECHSWPNREAGAVVDLDWTKVFIDDALLQYFYNPTVGEDTITATYCSMLDLWSTSTVKNAIRSLDTNWKTYGAYDRDAVLLNRDVKLGDTVKVSAVIDAELITLWTYVAGFINDKIAGVVGVATRDSGDVDYPFDTSSSSSPAISVTKVGFGTSTVDVSVADKPAEEPEQGYIDGVRRDDYVLEVIEGGEPASAVIRVTSASGTDDVDALTPSAWDATTPFGNKGLAVTFSRSSSDVFEVGMIWEISVQFGAVVVYPHSGGDYTGPSDSTYVITVTKGGQFGGIEGNPEITITTTTGIDSSGPHEVTALDEVIDIGSYGVELDFTSMVGYRQGLYLGDKFYIPVTAPVAGAVKTLVLGHNLPAELIGLDNTGACSGRPPALAVTLYIKKDIEVAQDREGYAPLLNWDASATEICLQSGILAYDSTWVDNSGTRLPLPVKSGSAWVTYRALQTVGASTIGGISDITTLAAILGTVTVDNPLVYGVYMAMLNSSGEEVKYVSVASNDVAGYTAALSKLTQRNDVYSIVVTTFDAEIQDLLVASVAGMSTPESGRWRRALVSSELIEEQGIVTETSEGDAYLATITDDPDTAGNQYTSVEFATEVNLLTIGVRAGDIVRALYSVDGFGNETYSEYTIDLVQSEDSLRLLSGPDAPVNTASRVEIWRNLTADEQIAATTATGSRFGTRRVTNVWPDYYEKDSELTPGYFEACAIAGLRSATVPQRSLTNIALAGIDSVNRTTEKFTEAQLNTMAAAGTLIVTQNMAGDVYIRHNLTTDMTSVQTREESITANLDSISYVVLSAIAPFIGSSNLTDETINQIKVEIKDIINYLVNNSTIPTVGGQLISGTITKVERHPTLLDRLVVVLNLELPAPVNNIEVHLVV